MKILDAPLQVPNVNTETEASAETEISTEANDTTIE